MTAALYRLPWFLALARLTKGWGWTLHASGRSVLEEHGASELSHDLAQLVMAPLPPRLRSLALGGLLAVGLWVRTPTGYLLREVPPAGLVVELPPVEGPSAATLRKRRQRDRQRDSAPVSRPPVTPSGHAVTAPVTPGVTSSVTERDRPRDIERDMAESSGVLPPNTSVTSSVTALASAPAREENSPSFSLPTFQKEEGEGEENSPPLPPPSRPAVTPPVLPTLTGPLGSALAGALAAIPGAPRGEVSNPEAELDARVEQVVALWVQATGLCEAHLGRRDLDAIRVKVQEGEPAADFKAAFAHAASDAWFLGGDGSRCFPRLVCGSKWAECVRKGKAKLGSAPQSQRRPVEAAPPSPPPAPAPQPPETLPWAPPANPRRLRDHLGARYQPLPDEGIYLRLDLYLARQQAQRSEAAE